jgi:hypothetical protein
MIKKMVIEIWKNKDQNCIKIQVKLNVEGQNK